MPRNKVTKKVIYVSLVYMTSHINYMRAERDRLPEIYHISAIVYVAIYIVIILNEKKR